MRNSLSSALALLFIIMLLGCGESAESHSQALNGEQNERGIPVEVISVTRGTIRASLRASSILEASEETDVIARVSGVVTEIYVDEGDFVEQGQALARIESSRYRFNRDQIAAEFSGVAKELERAEQLATQQMVSQETLERLRTRYQGLQAQLALAELDVSETVVRAPISGHVAQRFVRTGNMIQAYQQRSLFHLVNDKTLRAVIHLPEHALSNVRSGQTAEIKLQHNQTDQINAQVERISPIVDAASGTFRVVLMIPNEAHQYRAGMFARVQVHYAEKENVVRIPYHALIQIDQTSYVFVVEQNKAVRKELALGIRENGYIEIVYGIDEGAELVVTGQNTLREDARVEMIRL